MLRAELQTEPITVPGRRSRQRSAAYDVVFYTPSIGSMLSTKRLLPPGGAETQILMLAKGLARHGVRVGIIAYGEADELPLEIDGVRIIPRPPYNLGTKRLVGKVLETARIANSLRRAPSRTIVYRCASLELGLVGLYAKCTGRPLVFSTASVADFSSEQRFWKRRDRALYSLGLRLTDVIIVQTEEQVELCQSVFGRRPELIPSLAPVIGQQDAEPEAFLWVGRFVSYKQPMAYVELARALPKARFWMLGVPSKHPREQDVTQAVSAAAEPLPNLELLEPRPHAEVGRLMERAVASVNTASYEGMPNVLLEAWARGVPALVLEHDPGGVVSKHNLGGFADGSPEKLVELARSLWYGRHDRDELSQRCIEYIATHHSPDVAARLWMDALGLATSTDMPQRQTDPAACVG